MVKITKIEDGTAKNGNPLRKVYLSEKVNNRDMVFVFSDHTRYNDLTVGMELGPDEIVADGQYIKLVDPDSGIKGHKGGGSRSGMITKAMNEKAANIAVAQDKKEEGIRISSTIRMATDVVVALNTNTPLTPDQMREAITAWRAWFYIHWDDIDTSNTPPF